MTQSPPILFQPEIQNFLQRRHYERIVPRAALIDMDGTLYDSMKNHTAAWYRLISEQGIPCKREEFYLYEGSTGAATINMFYQRAFGRDATDEEVAMLYQRKTEYFKELPPVDRMPGALEMVKTFAGVGATCVLVTGSGQGSLLSRIDTDFEGLFRPDMRVTSRDVTHGKPHPEPFIRGMQLARVRPSESIVVENAPMGVEAGHRSGAFTIGVTTGPIPVQELERAGADLVFPSMQEFADYLPVLLYAMVTTVNG